ncbi:serine hydroxymethyltransferase [Patescibacteria group bacterium]|nr:serine hydroxymethyltransferase [Patescibacteria group bacterium]MBU2036314.1 serine hydroxymethyltransferase [Patescibacteria group bacterium]
MKNLDLLVNSEEKRQEETLMLIPSENYASKKVREFVGSRLSNKYSEGYPKRRYYQGNYFIDEIETLAIEKAKKLFNVPHANVQPYSGSPANSEILFALANFGDKIMGLKLSAGGHLTHGHPNITFSGRYFKSIQFGLDKDGLLNYKKIEELAKKEKPKVMIIGTTAYPLVFDWEKFAKITDSINAYLVADISHVSGLVLGGVYPDPAPFAHVLMTTTHKTLRGPRGAMIMVTQKGIKKDSELPSKIDKAVFPGLQGGPHNNTTAGIAQALIEADSSDFRKYADQIVKNAKVLANYLKGGGLTLVGGGTECHLMVVDLRPLKLSGNVLAEALEVAGIVVNRNSVPNDPMPPFYPSGIRLGTPAITTRGMREKEMKIIADWILKVVDHVKDIKLSTNSEERKVFTRNFKKNIQKDKFLIDISKEVKNFLQKYPIS